MTDAAERDCDLDVAQAGRAARDGHGFERSLGGVGAERAGRHLGRRSANSARSSQPPNRPPPPSRFGLPGITTWTDAGLPISAVEEGFVGEPMTVTSKPLCARRRFVMVMLLGLVSPCAQDSVPPNGS